MFLEHEVYVSILNRKLSSYLLFINSFQGDFHSSQLQKDKLEKS